MGFHWNENWRVYLCHANMFLRYLIYAAMKTTRFFMPHALFLGGGGDPILNVIHFFKCDPADTMR